MHPPARISCAATAHLHHFTQPVWAPLLVSTAMQSGVLLLTVYLKRHPRQTTVPLNDVVPGAPSSAAINAALLENAAAPGGQTSSSQSI